MMQRLPGTFSLRANADYFSSIVTQQTYQQDITRATNRNRRFGSYVTGAIGGYQVSATADRTDYFYTATSLTTYGSLPRVNISRPERPIAESPVYFGVQGEYVTLLRSSTVDDVKTQDQGLTRFDVAPTVRVPFNRWPFLGINSAVTWRATYWTERLQMQVPVPTVTASAGGGGRGAPVLRLLGPGDGAGLQPHLQSPGRERRDEVQARHPALGHAAEGDELRRVRPDRQARVGRLHDRPDAGDLRPDQPALRQEGRGPRDPVVVGESELLHRRARGAVRPCSIRAASRAKRASNFSPVALQFRASPSDRLQGDFRTEWDPTAHALRSIAANANFSSGDWLNGSAGWSQRRFVPGAAGLRRPEPVRPVHQLDGQHPRLAQQVRRQLLVQLRRQERPLPQSALGRLLQLPVLRRRRRVPDLQPAGLVRADERHAGPPLQHLVHAGRHRHLLEPVRRVRRAAEPLMTARRGVPLVTGAAGFAGGHLVEHLLEHEAHVAGWGHGPVPAASRDSDRVSWASVDITDRRGGHRGAGGDSPVGGLPLRRDRRRSQHLVGLGDRAPRQRHGHAQPARRARTPRARRARAGHRLGARLSAVGHGAVGGLADRPDQSLRRQQARAGARRARGARARHRDAAVQSRGPAAGAGLRHVQLRAADCRSRRPAFASRCWRSAISMRAATSPTCAIRCAPTGC